MELLHIVNECLKQGGGACALATVVETIGPAYRRAGARQIIRQDRKTWGAITGGCVESDLILHALGVIERGVPLVVRYSPSDDDPVLGLGSGCGGEVVVLIEPLDEPAMRRLREQLASPGTGDEAVLTVYRATESRLLGTRIGSAADAPTGALVQPITQPLSLLLFGASPAAESITRMAKQLGWNVIIADHRPIVEGDECFAEADEIVIAPAEELPGRLSFVSPTAAVVMTHHYLRDLELLKQLLPRQLAYLGVVGSRVRADRLAAELRSLGFTAKDLKRLRAPAGLDLGVDTPSEIGLSIIAEIQAVQRGTTAAALCNRRGSIHDDSRRNAIVVLAAGGSRRMGQPKQLMIIEEKSLVRRAVETALAAGDASVYVVAGAEADRVRSEMEGLPVDFVVNESWEEGIASSIRAGIVKIERDDRPIEAMVLMLCDQPGVSEDVLRRLFQVHRTTRAPVIASRYPDGPGVPALFRAEMFPDLKALAGDIGARQLIRHLDREVVTIPFDAPGDVDTPVDLALLAKGAALESRQ
jgi:xanthine dehydrogenase accessory factor